MIDLTRLARVVSLLLPATGLICLLPATATATYSIVAVDQATQQVGGGVTSCVGNSDVSVVYGSSPGRGAIHAQASLNAAGRNEGVRLLGMGTAPADIITAITASSFDASARTRQYGVVDLMGRSAGFTGAGAMNYKEDRQGSVGTFTYSAQGNILTSQLVIDQTEAGFRAGGCDLAERLMRALEAGAQNGEGDTRCTGPKQIPSDSAALQVDLPAQTAGGYLRISVRGTGSINPLVPLRTMFDTWRATHPCPGGVTDGGAGGGGGGGLGGGGRGGLGGQGGTGLGGQGGTTGPGGRGGSAAGTGGGNAGSGGGGSGGGGAAGQGGVGGAAGATGRGGSGAVDAGADGTPGSDAGAGCGCRVGASANDAIAAVLLIGMLLMLRLRSSRRYRRGRIPR